MRPGDRLLEAPVFILSSVRSGSTLLRVMLNTHSQIHAPHELHLTGVSTGVGSRHARESMSELGLSDEQLQFLLWDRVLQREVALHGKSLLVEKTPSNAFIWRKIVRCWPDARFIFLLRHPAAVTDSWARARKRLPPEEIVDQVRRYMDAVEDARIGHDGLTVRYEDVTADPEHELRRICSYLGLAYEPTMLDYSSAAHGAFRPMLGDWSNKLKSGRVQRANPLPTRDQLPEPLVDLARAWGYLT